MTLRPVLPLIFLSVLSCSKPNIPLYVGTYTDGDSEGIYRYEFNTETGQLNNKTLAAKSNNPSFITYSSNKDFIYAVNENKDGSVSSFKVESNGSLKFLNKVSSEGAHPCHIALDTKDEKLVVSNYTGGNAVLYYIKNDGSLNKAFQVVNHQTDSIVSHVHSAQFYKNQLYIADLGKNAVYNYELKDNSYQLVDSSIVKMTPNAGPRHFSLTNDGQFIYIINELSSAITYAKRNGNTFEFIETISALDDNFEGKSYCADIHLSKDERFVYGSNRGENSIVVFKRDTVSGKLEKIQNISTEGDWPRNFTLDPTGKFLLVANQRSNSISVFKIYENTGKLEYLKSYELDAPVCLLF